MWLDLFKLEKENHAIWLGLNFHIWWEMMRMRIGQNKSVTFLGVFRATLIVFAETPWNKIRSNVVPMYAEVLSGKIPTIIIWFGMKISFSFVYYFFLVYNNQVNLMSNPMTLLCIVQTPCAVRIWYAGKLFSIHG